MRKIFSLLLLGLLCSIGTTWADNVYKLQLNGSNVEIINGITTVGSLQFFSYNTEKHNFNSKFSGCTYDDVAYTKGLKMEVATLVSWTTSSTSTVTIVQSTYSDKTINFDGEELSISSAAAITGGRVYTISDVEAGDHTITRGSGESGLFAITVECEGQIVSICPSGISISGAQVYTEGQTISLTAALTAGNGVITYQWYKGGTAEENKLVGKTDASLTIAGCTLSDAGNYYCIASKADCDDAVSAAYAITVNEAPQGLTAVSDYMWEFSEWTNQTFSGSTIIDNLEVTALSDNKTVIDGNNKSIDGYNFSKRLKFGGNGIVDDELARYVHFKVAGNCLITVYGMSAKANESRIIAIKIGDEVVTELTNDGIAIGKVSYAYVGSVADVYVYGSVGANNLYGVKVEPGHPLAAEDTDFYGLYLSWAANIPSGISAYTGTLNGDESALTLTAVNGGVIPAQTPVLVKAAAVGTYSFTPSSSTADAILSSLKGVAVETPVAELNPANDGKIALTLGADSEGVVGFRQPAGTNLAANKVFILVNPQPTPAPVRIVFAEDNATNIENLDASEKAVKFIKNGQLFIQKDGVVYTAIGAVVK